MSEAFARLLVETADPAQPPKFILDAASYAQRVLLQSREVPWHDATAYANHLAQTQALLKPAVALVPLDRLFDRELQQNTALREAMAARSRAGFAAKTLLGDAPLKQRCVEIVLSVVKAQHEPVVLHLPAPLALLRRTEQAVVPEAGNQFDDDDAENTAIYYADWLRAFADLGIAGVVFDERGGAAAAAAYQPILNTAEHYGWPIGLRSLTEVRFFSPEVAIAVLDPRTLDADPGVDIPAAGVLLAEVPTDAVPEQILARLAALRAQH